LRRFTLILFSSLILCGCIGLMEKTGQVLDGSAFKEKIISHYKTSGIDMFLTKNKNNEQFLIISLSDYPMIKLKGLYAEHDNVYNLISIEYLAGNTHGWNEYTLDLLGETIAVSFDNEAILSALAFEKIQISKGSIHRYDTRITGNEALSALRNRRERIIAVTEWMKTKEIAPVKQSLKDFENYWKPILFPETVSKKKRPYLWLNKGIDKFESADGIRWNKGYTERVFPEGLHPVRDSATMLRDWEEALPWIYMEYHWDNIINIFTNEIILTKIK